MQTQELHETTEVARTALAAKTVLTIANGALEDKIEKMTISHEALKNDHEKLRFECKEYFDQWKRSEEQVEKMKKDAVNDLRVIEEQKNTISTLTAEKAKLQSEGQDILTKNMQLESERRQAHEKLNTELALRRVAQEDLQAKDKELQTAKHELQESNQAREDLNRELQGLARHCEANMQEREKMLEEIEKQRKTQSSLSQETKELRERIVQYDQKQRQLEKEIEQEKEATRKTKENKKNHEIYLKKF